ncbi:UDP-GlcNAc--UDP-phosphate GlcNAc-1-phosphate transferase [Sphingobacterium daejeonense]|uniref:UDP-GlcNAc--UDP-phosphate GlcNAc-1-phosphate transferase n=1 Tax=Sphingobacterium daejeonense TaxID=371142 RepID=UPI0021A41DC9|nr:UDP-GlcNAc--UDP-phosphate GlcNAc-1-phosphate transferase [Sphingobacterium daejeonense]MCT1532633.1 UDP-GlcNAc--UDP-phosphate GlcNAc-1-phosphate transferase [Sphingobacterium daejeonense]
MENLVEYTGLFILLFIIEVVYFKIADKYNIIDKPNLRSSHTDITLRGGGIIFYFAALAYYIISGFQYPWFFLGLTFMTIISFLDDILTLSNKIRLIVHFGSVLLLAYQLNLFSLPWYYLIITFIVVVGVINAYNFMDGINGMTACYSLSVCILLLIANSTISFIDQNLIIYSMVGVLVFSFFNFRNKAKTFAGDVGAVAIAFILLFCLGALIIKTGNFIYILFLTVYGIETVWTILRRLRLGENIFEAHRSHLYQFLGNEAGYNKLFVSLLYGLIQFFIGLFVIHFSGFDLKTQMIFSILLILIVSMIYIVLKNSIIKKHFTKIM